MPVRDIFRWTGSTIDDLFAESGLKVDRWVEDEQGYYALVLGSTV